jgi:hypothetical protein
MSDHLRGPTEKLADRLARILAAAEDELAKPALATRRKRK